MNQSSLITIMVFLGLFLSTASSCGKPEETESAEIPAGQPHSATTARSGGIYRFPLDHNPSTLDPAASQDTYSTSVAHQIFDCLVQFGPYLEILPALAHSWQMDETGTVYRFFLRPNVRFHNGRLMTAEDVLFSLERLIRMDPAPAILPNLLEIKGAQAFRNHTKNRVEGLAVLDSQVVLIRLTRPHMPLLAALGADHAAIVPKEEVQKDSKGFGRHPVGTGPFRFVAWQPDRCVRLERSPDYYAGPAYLDGVEFRIYPGIDRQKEQIAFHNQEIEEMPVISGSRQEFGDADNYHLYRQPSLSTMYYGINCRHPKLDDPGVRRAISQCIDRRLIRQDVYNNRFEIADGILPPGLRDFQKKGFLENGKGKHPPGPEEASEKKINLPASLEIASASISPFAKAEFEIVRQSFSKLGVDLKIKYITDWSQFIKYVESDQVQLYRYQWSADFPDPDNFLYPLFGSDSPLNYCRYQNEPVDRMLQKARTILDPALRTAMYKRIETLIMHDTPIVPLIHLSNDRVYQSYVMGVGISTLSNKLYPHLHRVWIDRPTETDMD